ncbi:TIGR03618 family F420-dependent PPOX class oxidoreductase [Actinoplanes sp. LDG1-06]|uniref:TIGR03618 family F420-dependent PPOX class oxidoreductase n=1 Tax=Paractinoplanes ovalisporus TaxID=2810368 RepID=A0ABS2ALA6_9ACTN|nr:TIGR03618 family F420-dependent PPOX class oxidoreductase [Actinoplanes ovalisporus]MBM2620602.1 TIGR03618 family F420-dependent PPOX class oxidoreductase [Actinoplanes ovalisporus]
MSTEPLSEQVVALLRLPNPAVMATVAADGRPVTVATWYLYEDDGRILLNLDGRRARLKHLRKDPRVSLTVLAGDNWYTHVSLQGRIDKLTDDEDLADIDALSRAYTGNPYPNRDYPRVSGRLVVERWHVWGDLSD